MKDVRMLVTPELAREWLKKNTRNRHINGRVVNAYATDMAAGRWTPSNEGVGFYDTGELADGQHRLAAIEKSGAAIELLVTWDIPVSSGFNLNSGKGRTPLDNNRISGGPEWINRNAITITHTILDLPRSCPYKASIYEIIQFAVLHRDAIEFAAVLFRSGRARISIAPVMTAVALASQYEDRGRLTEFCRALYSGEFSGPEDAGVVRLREWLFAAKKPSDHVARVEATRRVQRAIKAYCDREPIKKLYLPSDLIYPLKVAESDERGGSVARRPR